MVDYSFTEEQELFRESLREFCARDIAPKLEKLALAKEIPEDIIKALADFELLGTETIEGTECYKLQVTEELEPGEQGSEGS